MGNSTVELMRRIQAGDAAAFGELITHHERVLRIHLERYVSATDAEDLLQEVWLLAWQRAGQWDGRGRLLGWLLAIATNTALNHLRRKREIVSLAQAELEDNAETPASISEAQLPGIEEQVLWREELQRIRMAMAALPENKQEALRLVRIEGRSLQEAADSLGIPIGTLKSRLHHARKLLMEQLEEAE
jgi:RNA polymerase sigma-70 factor, ECF subfamily